MNRGHDVLGEVQMEILGYLDEHPNAVDSLEAIQQWWLLQRVARNSHSRIRQALDQLVDARLVERRVLSDGHEVYARASNCECVIDSENRKHS